MKAFNLKVAAITLFSSISGTTLLAANYTNYKPLTDTGQTSCYDVRGNKITCPDTGEPLYGQDASYDSYKHSFYLEGLKVNDILQNFIKDISTNIFWQQNKADINNDGLIDSSDSVT